MKANHLKKKFFTNHYQSLILREKVDNQIPAQVHEVAIVQQKIMPPFGPIIPSSHDDQTPIDHGQKILEIICFGVKDQERGDETNH